MSLTPEHFAAYDALPIGVVILRDDLVIEGWNKTVAGWSLVASEDAVGKSLLELFPEINAERFGIRMQSVFENGQSVVLSNAMHHQVLPLKTSSGRPLLHKMLATAASGERGRALLMVEDVTTTVDQLRALRDERRRLKSSESSLRSYSEELHKSNAALVEARKHAEAANAAKSQFLANVSHEIRTPLTAVKGFAEILLENAETEFAREAAERVVRNGEHLLAIVNDVLDLSKIESGELMLSPTTGSPLGLLEDICCTYKAKAEEKGVSLAIDVDESVPTEHYADPTRLRQVLVNLIDNAVKFTNEGEVRVKVCGTQSECGRRLVSFAISDTGVGVDSSKLEAIFDPFVQEDSSTQRLFGGTGLGLAICRRLTSQMRGTLVVTSEAGSGSTFTLQIPAGDAKSTARVEEPPRPVSNAKSPSQGEPLPLTGRRILVAEDGPDNRLLIEYLLSRAGADLTFVENGQLALDALLGAEDETPFDIIVLDMQMPVMDGYTAAGRLRDAGVTLPIIALTAHAMAGDRKKALEAGCDDYATKPIDPAHLIGLLAKLTSAEPAVSV